MDRSDLMKLPADVKFQELLEQLFQFDLADLDFGIYRVLRSRREAIQKYLAEELPKAASHLCGHKRTTVNLLGKFLKKISVGTSKNKKQISRLQDYSRGGTFR